MSDLLLYLMALTTMGVGCGIVYGITGRWFVVDSAPRVVAVIGASLMVLIVAGTIAVRLVLEMSP